MAVYHIRADAVDQRLEPPQPDKIADRGWELFPLQPLAAIIDRYPLPLQQRLIKRTAPLPQADDKPLDPGREMQQVVLDQRLRASDIQCINDLYDLHGRIPPFIASSVDSGRRPCRLRLLSSFIPITRATQKRMFALEMTSVIQTQQLNRGSRITPIKI